MQFTLAYPPSVNHYWRHYRGRTVISREGRDYRRNVVELLTSPARGGNGPRKPPAGGRIALAMDAFPPDRRRRDLDNIQKATLDSIEHAGIYEDDSQIDLLIVHRRDVAKPGRVEIWIDEFPLRRCPLCGGKYPPPSPTPTHLFHERNPMERNHPHDN